MAYMIRATVGASGSPVFGQTGQVTQDEPCSQKGKRIKSGTVGTGGQGAGIGIDISGKTADFCVKNPIFES